jgi:hypothetical protein
MGELINDKPIQNSRHDTNDIKIKNKLIREAYFQTSVFDDKEGKWRLTYIYDFKFNLFRES